MVAGGREGGEVWDTPVGGVGGAEVRPEPERSDASIDWAGLDQAGLQAELAALDDPDALAQRISDLGVALAGATIGTVFLRRLWKERDRFVPNAVTGAEFSAFPELPAVNPARVNPDSLFGGLFVHQRPALIPDVRAHPAFRGLPRPHPPVRSMLAAPLPDAEGRGRGVLVLGHREPNRFGEAEYRRILDLAALAGARLAELRLIPD